MYGATEYTTVLLSLSLSLPQLVALIQHHPFITVYGPSCSGKSTAIQTAVETLRQLPMIPAVGGSATHITCTTIAVGALREEQLLGHQQHGDRYVLLSMSPSTPPPMNTLCPKLLADGRATYYVYLCSLRFSNIKGGLNILFFFLLFIYMYFPL